MVSLALSDKSGSAGCLPMATGWINWHFTGAALPGSDLSNDLRVLEEVFTEPVGDFVSFAATHRHAVVSDEVQVPALSALGETGD